MSVRVRTVVIGIALLAVCLGCSGNASPRGHDVGSQAADGGLGADISHDASMGDVERDATRTCGSNDTIVKASNLDSIEGCEVVLSTIQLVDYFEPQVRGVEQLKRAEFGLVFNRVELSSLSSFSNLEFVGRILSIKNAPELMDLSGFNKLAEVDGPLMISDLPLADLSDLGQLERTAGLELRRVPNLESLEGLQQLSLIEGDVSVAAEQISREEFAAFLERVEVTGSVEFNGESW